MRSRAHGRSGRGRRAAHEHLLGAREGAGEGVLACWASGESSKRSGRTCSSASADAWRARRAMASRERAPFVDLVFGPQTLHRLPDMIAELRRTGRAVVDVSFPEIEKFDRLPEPRAEGATAFVSVMEGCSRYCSFCIVPYTRGDEISRPFESVLQEVRQLASQGVREVTLARAERQRVCRPHGGWRRRRPRHPDSSRRAPCPASSASASPPRIRSSSTTA